MPYNNTPVLPPKETTGQVSLPLARIKKIINTDEDIQNCSNNAAFVMTIATEMFIQHLTERAYEMVKSEKRPRKNLQYNDVANAVARIDNLEFLSDVVPRSTTYNKYIQKRGPNFKPGDSVSASKAAAGQSDAASGGAPRLAHAVEIFHLTDNPEPPLPPNIFSEMQNGDHMDVDSDTKLPDISNQSDIDPVQEQLAFEMGKSMSNGR